METFRLISLTACLLGIVISVFSTLYPSEKFAGQVKMIFSLIFILCIAKPLAEGKFEFPELSETVAASSDHYSALRDSADDYFIRSAENNISTVIETSLHEIGIYPEEVETSINISEHNSISINEVRIVLSDISVSDTVLRLVSGKVGNDAAVTIIAAEEKGDRNEQVY